MLGFKVAAKCGFLQRSLCFFSEGFRLVQWVSCFGFFKQLQGHHTRVGAYGRVHTVFLGTESRSPINQGGLMILYILSIVRIATKRYRTLEHQLVHFRVYRLKKAAASCAIYFITTSFVEFKDTFSQQALEQQRKKSAMLYASIFKRAKILGFKLSVDASC